VLSDVLHTVHGDFRLKEGHLAFDPQTKAMAGSIIVDSSSGKSGSTARDKRMTRDILEASRFPEMLFNPIGSSESIALSGTSDVDVTGSFVIHGQAHKITIPVHVQTSQNQVIATGQFLVPYVQWGMKNPSTFLLKLNDKVEIHFNAVGHIKAAANAAVPSSEDKVRIYLLCIDGASASGNDCPTELVQNLRFCDG